MFSLGIFPNQVYFEERLCIFWRIPSTPTWLVHTWPGPSRFHQMLWMILARVKTSRPSWTLKSSKGGSMTLTNRPIPLSPNPRKPLNLLLILARSVWSPSFCVAWPIKNIFFRGSFTDKKRCQVTTATIGYGLHIASRLYKNVSLLFVHILPPIATWPMQAKAPAAQWLQSSVPRSQPARLHWPTPMCSVLSWLGSPLQLECVAYTDWKQIKGNNLYILPGGVVPKTILPWNGIVYVINADNVMVTWLFLAVL